MKINFVFRILLLGAVSHGARVMAQSPGTFTATGNLTTERSWHTATLLTNGKVLVAGGLTNFILATAELYDPSTGTFTATGSMTTARWGHTATPLPNGKVLIAGGFKLDSGNSAFAVLASAELYDPSTGIFTAIGMMTKPRAAHTATLFANGTVLIAGGLYDGFNTGSSAELYDPVTGRFMPTGNMTVARSLHIATLLPNGKVLIVPAGDGSSFSAEIYDPETGVFSATDWKDEFEIASSVNLLPNGKVLVTLNAEESCFSPTGNLAVLYDPSAGVFTPTANMFFRTCRPSGTPLPDGTVLVAGGYNSSTATQVYDPTSGVFSRSGNMTTDRHEHTATLLTDGTVLLAGGSRVVGSGLVDPSSGTAEIYHPAMLVPSPVLFSVAGGAQGAILHSGTGQVVSASNPAVAGEALEIYLTGLTDGGVIPPQVAIGGRMAQVLFYGKAPGFVGLNQVNVRVPSGVAPGDAVSVRLTYLARPSNEVTIGVE